MQKTERKALFDLGQLVATPGALAALEKSGQSPMDFLSRPCDRRLGRDSGRGPQGEPTQFGKGFSAHEQLSHKRECRGVGDYRRFEVPHDFAFTGRVLSGNRDKENRR